MTDDDSDPSSPLFIFNTVRDKTNYLGYVIIDNMVQILQITLRTLEFKNRLAHSSKAQLKLSFGEIEKPFPHPRVIKDDRIKFDGQRMSLSSYAEEQILKVRIGRCRVICM